jgi:dolichol-phosphate mannosyltransferase
VLPMFAGMHRFLPTLVMMQGFRLKELPVNHRPRLKGKSKYTIGNRLWVGLWDTFGVLWLRKRAFHYQIKTRSNR